MRVSNMLAVDRERAYDRSMSEAHSKASKARWASVSPEEKSKRMSEVAKARMAKLTPEERKEIADSLVRARANKK